MKTRILVTLACAALAFAVGALSQNPSQPPQQFQQRMQRSSSADIRTVLDLTDRQYDELNDVRAAYLGKMADWNQQLRDLGAQRRQLQGPNADPARLASLQQQQQILQQQIQDETSAYHDNAMVILTADQRDKVQQIEDAMKLAPQGAALSPYGLLDAQAQAVPGRGGFGGGYPTAGPSAEPTGSTAPSTAPPSPNPERSASQ